MDPLLKRAFWDEFRSLRDRGRTLLVSTNQIDEAAYCDRLLVLREGRVLAEGTPDELAARGGAAIRVRVGERTVERRLERPAAELAILLREYGLSPEVASIEVKADSLEEVLVRMIRAGDGAP